MPDVTADFSDQGLVQTISAADMDNTDIYIFRASNDQLIMSREGLANQERTPMCGNCVDQNQGRINTKQQKPRNQHTFRQPQHQRAGDKNQTKYLLWVAGRAS